MARSRCADRVSIFARLLRYKIANTCFGKETLMRTPSLAIASLLLASAAMTAAETKTAGADYVAAFERLKSLTGEWQAETKMGKSRMSYELIAHGTTLVERESFDKMPAMMTVYHLDGDRLMLTHYCMAGNQPRMQARAFDPTTGVVQFQFLDATNLPDPKTPHMHNATIHIGDGRLVHEWQFYENERLKETHAAEYTRVR